MSTIVVTGGGTAGHIMPHIVLKPHLDKHFGKVVYIGSKNGMEKDIVKKHGGFEFYEIETVKLDRSKILKNLLIPFKFLKGKKQAKKILKHVRPAIVFSKGGYVALPVVSAAKSLKIPIVAHESDLSMGLANRLSKNKCSCICTTFEQTAKHIGKKGVYTGSPISIKINNIQKPDTNKPILLVTGGSLGSRAINQVVWNSINELCKTFYVIHQVGKGNINPNIKNANYKQIEFAGDLASLIKQADIVVSRAGSNTIFELATYHKPMLLIPLPKGASRGDQVDNAKYFESLGYAKVLLQEHLNTQSLVTELNTLLTNKQKYISTLKNANLPNGTEKILNMILLYKNPC